MKITRKKYFYLEKVYGNGELVVFRKKIPFNILIDL
jgi:hypothetical protein